MTDKPDLLTFSDEVLAQRFIDQRRADLRYTASWRQWLIWDGRRWAPDEKLTAFSLVRRFCYERAQQAERGEAKGIASAGTVAAIERLARADQRIAVAVAEWDIDPWMLNTPAGTIDLRTGNIRDCNPADKLTKIVGVAPDRNCPIPLWISFLDTVTGGSLDLVAFLQRIAGYSLTGSTAEHSLFFIFGTGANGKTTFINTITACAGEYHRVAPIETFTASSTDRHPTELAGLRGARLVTAVETEEGRRWDESKIKALTGGDPISARFMRQDFFQYTPQFKLIIAGNHKPGLRSVDEAIRRRFNLIPFTVTIPPERRDPDLFEKLKPEWPGILKWAIDGCLAWQRDGLPPLSMAINVSPRQFSDENLLRDVDDALAASGMDPKLLQIEITESMVMLNVDKAVQLLDAIQSRGVRLAIDDFGTGYSSMSVMKRFPIDTIKIDRSFVRELPHNSEDKAIAQAIIGMGKALGLTIIAEGVETSEQEDFLREHACDEIQGFLCSKPVAADKIAELLRLPCVAAPALQPEPGVSATGPRFRTTVANADAHVPS